MKLMLIVLFLLLGACGEKKKSPPLKTSSSSSSNLSISPSGIAETQKVFDLYSKNGKLNLAQIRNIGHRLSPIFGTYLSQVQIEEPPGTLYSARELFTLLGESNRVFKWALEYDLSSAPGWRLAINNEFSDAGPEVKGRSLELIDQALAQPDQFISMILKVGKAYNIGESIQLPEGSLGLNLIKYHFLALNTAEIPTLNATTTNLLKFNVMLEYILLAEGNRPDANAVATTPGQLSRWVLDSFKRSIEPHFPQLNFEAVDKVYWSAVSRAAQRVANKADLNAEHRFVHPSGHELIAINTNPTEERGPELWSGLGIFNYVVATCPTFRPSTTSRAWMNFLSQEQNLSELELYGPNVCAEMNRFSSATDRN